MEDNFFYDYIEELKNKDDLTERELRILKEAEDESLHIIEDDYTGIRRSSLHSPWTRLEDLNSPTLYYYHSLKTIDELLDRDKKREKDGFPRKIRLGRIIKPGKGGKNEIVIVPTTVEEKLYHDEIKFKSNNQSRDGMDGQQDETMGGTGEVEEGDILGETPVHQEGQGQRGAGQGDGEGHDVTSNAYDLGKVLTEKFKLPNLKDKGKKKTFTKYKYDLTDKNRGFGQVLDKKATLKRIIQTNQALGRLDDLSNIDSSKFLVDPKDKVYRILSKEKDYESQALIFFVRDYSGSMYGKPTEIVMSQHLMIYSWLLFQYENQVETKFVLHDSEAKEVPDFYTYYNLSIAGGTYIASAYKMVNEMIIKNSLDRDYNIYVFHGTDGDDMNTTGVEAINELRKMIKLVNRVGITVVKPTYYGGRMTTVEQYITRSNLLKQHPELIQMSVISENSTEENIINSIKDLIKEK